jgi:spore germination protein PC
MLMYPPYDMFQYLQQLHSYVLKQEQKMKHLESIVKKLENEVNEIKKKPSTTIERIEYKFDQLKVETLEGTLNIGLNPSDSGAIDDFSVSQGNMHVPPYNQFNQEYIQAIRGDVAIYLEDECMELIHEIEKKHGASLDQAYRDFIIDDISKQLDTRIEYHLNQQLSNPSLPRNEPEIIHQNVVVSMKADIENAINAFIVNLPDNMKGGSLR